MGQACSQFLIMLFVVLSQIAPARPDDQNAVVHIQEEVWALPLVLPTIAYVVRPVGGGPFPLAVMNHGVSLDPVQRSFFPLVEFRDAAMWFARRGYLVVAPVGSGYGASAIDIPERGLYGPFFSKIGSCTNPNFRDAGMAVAQLDLWIIDYMAAEKKIVPKDVIVIGQSAGGWASIALSSVNPPQVKAIITFAAGRGGRVDGKPNNNCARTDWSRLSVNSAAPRGCRCSGSTLQTTRSSTRRCRNGCTRRSPPQAATPNTTFFRRSATMDISWSAQPTPFRSGRRSSVRSWTDTSSDGDRR